MHKKISNNITAGYKYVGVFAEQCYACEMRVREEGAHTGVHVGAGKQALCPLCFESKLFPCLI